MAPKPKPLKFSYSISPDTGSSTQDHYTSGTAEHKLTLSGTGAASDTVTVSYLDPVSQLTITLTTTIQANGTWTLTTGALADGSYTFSIKEIAKHGPPKASATWRQQERSPVPPR
jgi:Bacterial Ig-like domain